MTEAERLRAQAKRCTQLAQEAKDKATADVLIRLAAKSLKQASDLERRTVDQRQQRASFPGGTKCPLRGFPECLLTCWGSVHAGHWRISGARG